MVLSAETKSVPYATTCDTSANASRPALNVDQDLREVRGLGRECDRGPGWRGGLQSIEEVRRLLSQMLEG